MKPSVGRVVHYVSRNGDGIVSPAIVLRTRESTNFEVIQATRPRRPLPLPDDTTVDLLVHGLGEDYREYGVPQHQAGCGPFSEPRTWHWPERTE